MATLGDDYDIALVLDADNVIPYDYLNDVNDLYARPGVEIVQTHRMAKNINSNMALLDAISEEINNTIFRLGHVKLGMSAALIGSGMAFRYDLFRATMANVKAVGGFDRELELTLLYQGKYFHYLPETYVFDEKYRTPMTSPVSVVVGCRRSGTTAPYLPNIYGKPSISATGIFATRCSSNSAPPACCY